MKFIVYTHRISVASTLIGVVLLVLSGARLPCGVEAGRDRLGSSCCAFISLFSRCTCSNLIASHQLKLLLLVGLLLTVDFRHVHNFREHLRIRLVFGTI